MTLFKVEDILSEIRPGLTLDDIRHMPFWEFMLKLDIIKERTEEQKKREEQEAKKQEKQYVGGKSFKPLGVPKLPKMPKY